MLSASSTSSMPSQLKWDSQVKCRNRIRSMVLEHQFCSANKTSSFFSSGLIFIVKVGKIKLELKWSINWSCHFHNKNLISIRKHHSSIITPTQLPLQAVKQLGQSVRLSSQHAVTNPTNSQSNRSIKLIRPNVNILTANGTQRLISWTTLHRNHCVGWSKLFAGHHQNNVQIFCIWNTHTHRI